MGLDHRYFRELEGNQAAISVGIASRRVVTLCPTSKIAAIQLVISIIFGSFLIWARGLRHFLDVDDCLAGLVEGP